RWAHCRELSLSGLMLPDGVLLQSSAERQNLVFFVAWSNSAFIFNFNRGAKSMRRIGYWAAALIIVAGCSDQKNAANWRGAADAGSSAAKRITIAVIPKAATHEFWKSVHFG